LTAVGGALGNAHERGAKALLRDYLDGKVSAEKIQADYGIDVRNKAGGRRACVT
jgi:N-methylhydantoinase B/oxoprolinase/acetone carboxylase alpha subunit